MTVYRVVANSSGSEIGSIRSKALRRFAETGVSRGIDSRIVDRLSRMLLFLGTASSPEALSAPPNYGAHQLTGNRAGTWSLTVTRNWRLTFRIDEAGAIVELDLEDYH